mmetsp:Transcript_32584/g.56461  ORF Transcript_32584/g.56461 Transcript_32584/m.56461 type:complete len:149 (+) Transcript_32584:1893-2339(+)
MDNKDRLFQAIEQGDTDLVKAIIHANPSLLSHKVGALSPVYLAARHGHADILAVCDTPNNRDAIIELIKAASIDGHKEAVAFLMHRLARHFDFKNPHDEIYAEVMRIVPDSVRTSVLSPYYWHKRRGMLYIHKKGLLPIKIKKLAKFL